MFSILKSFFTGIYDLLPDSPFQTFFADRLGVISDMLGWINWFIPFDLCFKITEVWVTLIAAYYLFSIVKKIVLDLVIKKILA